MQPSLSASRSLHVVAFLTALATYASITPPPADAQLRFREWIRVRRGPQLPAAYRESRGVPPFEDPAGDAWLTGRFMGFLGDTLILEVSPDVIVPVALRPVPPEVQRRRKIGHRAREGAVVGGGIGLGLGAILVGLAEENGIGSDEGLLDDGEVGKLVAATAIGAAVGALVGLSLAEFEWEGVRVRAGPTSDGGALHLSLRPRRRRGG